MQQRQPVAPYAAPAAGAAAGVAAAAGTAVAPPAAGRAAPTDLERRMAALEERVDVSARLQRLEEQVRRLEKRRGPGFFK